MLFINKLTNHLHQLSNLRLKAPIFPPPFTFSLVQPSTFHNLLQRQINLCITRAFRRTCSKLARTYYSRICKLNCYTCTPSPLRRFLAHFSASTLSHTNLHFIIRSRYFLFYLVEFLFFVSATHFHSCIIVTLPLQKSNLNCCIRSHLSPSAACPVNADRPRSMWRARAAVGTASIAQPIK